MLVQAIVVVDPSRNDTEYLTWKEECFESLRDNDVDICQSEFILNNLLLARNNALSKVTADYVFIIDPDDYIGPGYVDAMLSTLIDDKEILYPFEMRIISPEIIIPSSANKLKPTKENLIKPSALAHHPFGRRETLKYLYGLCEALYLDADLFKQQADEQDYKFKLREEAIYFWRRHPTQYSNTTHYKNLIHLNKYNV